MFKLSKSVKMGLIIGMTLIVGVASGVGIGAGLFSGSSSSENLDVNEFNIKRLFSYDRKIKEEVSYPKLENYPSEGSKFPVKLVIDAGAILDKSFNEQVLDSLLDIYYESNNRPSKSPTENPSISKLYETVDSGNDSEIKTAYENSKTNLGALTKTIVDGQEQPTATNKKVILAPGGLHKSAIQSYWKDANNSNDETRFILIDDNTKLKNTYGFTFDTKTPSFRIGYLTGLFLEAIGDTSPTAGMWGGGNFPGITDYMIGYTAGIKYYNDTNSTSVNDVKIVRFPKDEAFTNSHFNPGGGREKADYLVAQGADVILPVAGVQVNDAIGAINASPRKDQIKVIGSDGDLVKAYEGTSDQNIFITSILKNLRKAMYEGYKSIAIGRDTDEIKDSLVNEDTTINWKHFNVGEDKGFSGYTKEFSEGDWVSIYEKIDVLTIDFINKQKVFEKQELLTATWDNALSYIKSL